LDEKKYHFLDFEKSICRYDSHFEILPDHLSFASEKIVVDILKNLGFDIISIHKFRSPVYPKLTPMKGARVIYSMLKGSYVKRVRLFPKYPNIDMWIRARLNKYKGNTIE